MSKIYIEFDDTLQQSDIIVPIVSSSITESGEEYDPNSNKYGVQQTSIYGVLSPLVKINNIAVAFRDIVYFRLSGTERLPEIRITVHDRYKLHSLIDTPKSDNTLRVQILPPFDNAYKKINITFHIDDFIVDGPYVTCTGTYYCPELRQDQYASFGNIDTYALFKEIAMQSSLGFATNVESPLEDNRYIYCDYRSYQDLLNREVRRAANNKTHIYDWWVDYWNNINFVDIYDIYNSAMPEDEMQVWVKAGRSAVLENETPEIIQVPAVINNHPFMGYSSLTAKTFSKQTDYSAQTYNGTDKIISMYECEANEYKTYLIQDGDVSLYTNTKCTYVGEVHGSYNYLLAEACYDSYMQKMGLEKIVVELQEPFLGLIRGDKVDFLWFTNDTLSQQRQDEFKNVSDLIDSATEMSSQNTASSVTETGEEGSNPSSFGGFKMDDSVSGQYTIVGTDIIYENSNWRYMLTLQRPTTQTPNLMNSYIKDKFNFDGYINM